MQSPSAAVPLWRLGRTPSEYENRSPGRQGGTFTDAREWT